MVGYIYTNGHHMKWCVFLLKHRAFCVPSGQNEEIPFNQTFINSYTKLYPITGYIHVTCWAVDNSFFAIINYMHIKYLYNSYISGIYGKP